MWSDLIVLNLQSNIITGLIFGWQVNRRIEINNTLESAIHVGLIIYYIVI